MICPSQAGHAEVASLITYHLDHSEQMFGEIKDQSNAGNNGPLQLRFLSGPIASAMTNRFGCRLTIMVGGAISGLGVMISYFAPNIYFLYFSFGIMTGAGLGIAYIPGITAVAEYFEKYRSLATGIAVSGVGVGTFIFPPLITVLAQVFSWRGSLLIVGAILLNLCVSGAMIRPITRPELRRDEKAAIFDVSAFKKIGYIILCANNVLACFGLSVVYLHLTAFAEEIGMSDDKSAMLMSAIGISNLVGRFVMGALGTHPRLNVFVIYSTSWVLAGVAACFYPVCSNTYVALVMLSALFGFFTASFGALLPPMLVAILGIHRFANGYGCLLIFMAVGQMIGGPTAGFLYDLTHSYNTSFFVGGATLIVGGVLMFFEVCRKRKSGELPDLEIAVTEEKQPLPCG